jgi:hypothetical protein
MKVSRKGNGAAANYSTQPAARCPFVRRSLPVLGGVLITQDGSVRCNQLHWS